MFITFYRFQFFFLFLLFTLLLGNAQAQFGSQSSSSAKYPATVEAFLSTPPTKDQEVEVIVRVTIDPTYHIYGMNALVDPKAFGPFSTKLSLDETPLLKPIEGEEWREPLPKQKMDPAFDTEVRYHTGTVEFRRRFLATENAELPLKTALTGFVHMQICDESVCLPPRKSPFSISTALPVSVETTPAPTPTPTPQKLPAEIPKLKTEVEQLESQGVWKVAGLAFVAGLLSLLTPCVFPMIPITISFFTKQAAKTTSERIILVGVYSGSIVLGFALVGFGLALAMSILGFGRESAGLINSFAANPWVNLMLAGFFVAFALSLFGVFEIGLPSSWANAIQQKKGKRKDWFGAMLMAMIFVIISFTCTAPIVGPLIVLTLQGGVMLPAIGLTAYAVGFALPFMILGLVPSALSALPKSGSWLHASKVTFGLVELGIALVYVGKADLVLQWGIASREVILAAWVAIADVTMLYLLGVFRTKGESHGSEGGAPTIGPARLTFAVLFGTLGMYFAFGLFSGRLSADLEALLPRPRTAAATQAALGNPPTGHELSFIENDLDAALVQAKAEGKPLFVDFTGWTCTNCWRNALDVFPRPEIKGLLEQYVRVSLYTDDAEVGEKWQKYQSERFETFSLPFYVVLSPDNEVIATFGGLIREGDVKQFQEFLEMGIKPTIN